MTFQVKKKKKSVLFFSDFSHGITPKLNDSVVTDTVSLPCSARWTEVSGVQAGINAWSELLWKYP